MDKLSRFGTGDGEVKLTSEGGKSLDDVTEGLEEIAAKQAKVLEQLQLTHVGHEEELWGKEIRKDEAEVALEELSEE